MASKRNRETKEAGEMAAAEKAPDDVAVIEIPVSEPVRVTYTDELGPAPPGLEIHPRRALPPLPEAKPEPENPQNREPQD